jgi:hypothetical protein
MTDAMFFLLNAACLAEKQQIPISKSFVLPDQISNYHTRGKHYTTDIVNEKYERIHKSV